MKILFNKLEISKLRLKSIKEKNISHIKNKNNIKMIIKKIMLEDNKIINLCNWLNSKINIIKVSMCGPISFKRAISNIIPVIKKTK